MSFSTKRQLHLAAVSLGARLTKLTIRIDHLHKDWPPPVEMLHKERMSTATARSYLRAEKISNDPKYDVEKWEEGN